MENLKQMMIDKMILKGFSENTIQTYVWQMKKFIRFFGNRPPGEITDEMIQSYILNLVKTEKRAYETVVVAICSIKLFFTEILNRPWTRLEFIHMIRAKQLPVVLSKQEVERIFETTINLKYKAIFN